MSVPPEMQGVAPGQVAPSNQTSAGEVAINPGVQTMDPNTLAMLQQTLMGMAPQVGQPKEEPKPPRLLPAAIADKIASALNNRKKQMADQLVDNFGPPRGFAKADVKQLLRAYRFRDPNVDIDALRANNTSWDDIVDLAYPLRRTLILTGRPSWEDRVKFAEYLNALDKDPEYATLDDGARELPKAEFPSDIEEEAILREDTEEDE
jgi:hypothetical protein